MHAHHEHIMPLKVRRGHWVYSAWLEVGCWRYATEGRLLGPQTLPLSLCFLVP